MTGEQWENVITVALLVIITTVALLVIMLGITFLITK